MQAIAIALIALVIAPGFSFYFDIIPKLCVLLVALALCLAFTRPARPGPFHYLAILFFGSLALSLAFSPMRDISAFGSNWRRFGVIPQIAILLFAGWLSVQAHRILPILRVIVAAGAITAIYGIAQYFGFDPFLPASAYHVGEGAWTIVRPPSTLGYASYFATWLLFVIFLSLAMPGRIWKCAAAVAAIAMVLTGTRAAILGLAAGAAVWFFWRGWRISRRTTAIAAAVLIAGAIFYYSPPGWQMRSRTRWFVEDPWGGPRPLLWRDSLRMAAARPFTGHGPETFMAVFPRYQSRELARAYPDFAHESPHNIFLDALVSQGIPGMLLLAAFCAAAFRAAWRARDKHPTVAAALAAALAAGIVAQQFTAFTIPTAVIFFATAALACGLESNSGTAVRPVQSWTRAAPVLLALVFTAAAILDLAARIAIADHALVLTRRALDARDIAAAQRLYASARIPGASSDLWYSRALARAAALQPAIDAGLRATETADDPFNAWYSLSALYASQNDLQRAELSLRNAIRTNPTWFKPHWTLARLLALTGRTAEAAREAGLALDLDAGKHPEVTQTLQSVVPALKPAPGSQK